MSWIRTVPVEQATGLLKQIYDAALKRAGKVFHIIDIQSLRPRVLRASTTLYMELMHQADGGLSRAQREMIATAVSRANGCFY